MYAEAAMVNSRLCELGLKTREWSGKKWMDGMDTTHWVSKFSYVNSKPYYVESKPPYVVSKKKKGIENELCSFENYLGGIGKQLCGFEMTCWALCGVETTQVKLKLL